MLLKMKRTQKTRLGRLLKGVAYAFDMNDSAQAATAKDLQNRKMAVKTTAAAVAREAEDAAARERAMMTGDIRSPQSAVEARLAELEMAEANRKAKEEAERKAKEEADRKAKEEAERKAKEEAAKKADATAKSGAA